MALVPRSRDDDRPADPDGFEASVKESGSLSERSAIFPVVEEIAVVRKRRTVTGRVRVTTRTETRCSLAVADLDRNMIDVVRVPVGRVVDRLPPVRNEGSTTIVPVVEERLVVVKQLFLVEELHIRQEVKRDAVRLPVELRRQTVAIERFDAEGGAIVGEPDPSLPPSQRILFETGDA